MNNVLLINELKSRLPSNLYMNLVMSKKLENLDEAQSSQLATEASYMKKPTLVWLFALLLGSFGAHRFYAGKPTGGIVFIILTIWMIAASVYKPNADIDNIIPLIYIASVIDGVVLSKKIAARNYRKVTLVLD